MNFSYRSNPNPLTIPPMNARSPLGFQRQPFPPQVPQKSNLEAIMETTLIAQQKQDEYIKQLASNVDMLTTHNKMLQAQIAQQDDSSSTPPGKLPLWSILML